MGAHSERSVPRPAGHVPRTCSVKVRAWYACKCNEQMGGASQNFTVVTKFLPRKLRIFANSSISRKFCAAKIWSYTVLLLVKIDAYSFCLSRVIVFVSLIITLCRNVTLNLKCYNYVKVHFVCFCCCCCCFMQ